MLRLVVHRLVFAVPLLILVSALSFVLTSLTPGDAARQILGTNGTPAQVTQLRHSLGLNLPVYEQYFRWFGRALSGDLGTSTLQGQPVADLIRSRLPVTLSLIFGALLVSVVVGVLLGVVSAVRGGILGRVIDVLSLVGWALPVFWVGSELIVIFAIKLHWLPAVGYVPFGQAPVEWLKSLVLPVTALSLGPIAALSKQTRESMLDILGSEHIRIATANGIGRTSLIYRHALKNAATPVITVIGIQAIGLLGGSILIENVFAVPGLGTLVVTSSLTHDLPIVQGVAVVFAVVVIVVNLVVDVAYGVLNPKLRAR